MKKVTITLMFSVLMFTTTLNGATQSIQSLVQEVLTSNPELQERLQNFYAANNELDVIQAGFLPKLDLEATYGREQTKSKSLTNDEKKKLTVHDAKVILSHNIFKGFETMHAENQQVMQVKALAYQYLEKANELSFRTIEAYLNLRKQTSLLAIEKENIAIHEKTFSDLKKKQMSGLGRVSDVKEAGSKLALAYSNYLSQENDFQKAKISLHKLVGRYINPNDIDYVVGAVAIPKHLPSVIQTSLENNPSMRVAHFEHKRTLEGYEVAKSKFYPEVDLKLQSSVTDGYNAVDEKKEQMNAIVSLKYNLFNGGADIAAKEQKVAELHAQNQKNIQTKRDLLEQIQTAWVSNQMLEDSYRYLEKYVESSHNKMNAYVEEFTLGRRSLIDLMLAQDDYNEARRKIVTTETDLAIERNRILLAMGVLADKYTNNVQMNVGLHDQVENFDFSQYPAYSLPEKDGDGIEDFLDHCDGSAGRSTSPYGCTNGLEMHFGDINGEMLLNENSTVQQRSAPQPVQSAELTDTPNTFNQPHRPKETNYYQQHRGQKLHNDYGRYNYQSFNKPLSQSSYNTPSVPKSYKPPKAVAAKKPVNKPIVTNEIAALDQEPQLTSPSPQPIQDTFLPEPEQTTYSNDSFSMQNIKTYQLTKNSNMRSKAWGDIRSIWVKGNKIRGTAVDNEWVLVDALYIRDHWAGIDEPLWIHKNNLTTIN
jgi:adhesin transport system outer membrane protein